jgi:hypothetical protein
VSIGADLIHPQDPGPPSRGTLGLVSEGEAKRSNVFAELAAFGKSVLGPRAEQLYRREERLADCTTRRDEAVTREKRTEKQVDQGTHTLRDGPYAAAERGINTPGYLIIMGLLCVASWFVNQAALLVLQLPLTVTLALATFADVGLLVAAHLTGDYWKRRHHARDFRRQLGGFENVGWIIAVVVGVGIILGLATVRLVLSGLLGAIVIGVLLTLSFLIGAWLSYKHTHDGVRSLERARKGTAKAQKNMRVATGLRNTALGEFDAALLQVQAIASRGLAEWRLLQQLYLDAALRDEPDSTPTLPEDPAWVEELEKLASGEARPKVPAPERRAELT